MSLPPKSASNLEENVVLPGGGCGGGGKHGEMGHKEWGKLNRPPRSKNSSIFFGRKMIQLHSTFFLSRYCCRGKVKNGIKFTTMHPFYDPNYTQAPSKNTFSFSLSMCAIIAAPAPTVICSSVIASSERSCCCSVRTITAPLM